MMNKDKLAEKIGERLRRQGWQLAIAESCTGGLVSHHITNIPGASTYYLGSIIAYAYHAKVRLLDVSWDTLEEYGAVSEETVKEMAQGVRQALGSDVGLSISGIAGPGGGTADKPVGTACLGLSAPGEIRTKRIQANGSRLENKEEFCAEALKFLEEHLREHG